MNNRKRVGIISALIGLIALIVWLNAGTSASVINWPVEAYLGAVFTIGWLTGVPDWLAYLLAVLLFVLVIVVCYKLGSWLYGLVFK
ncbi:hypothetical protein [uncultured Psychrobacter sp.]|uniref:hypothetical protein n=1 Tax=uncultured Psychrobacter sp. TaxID=259303 RepID=UPI003458D41B